ncbi:hypothetical protein [Jannaschia ovalis]|uniref:Lipoprotein n=1 Tax=Jannaschia ovalis TaxID=3038773 RepID=A0ABY8LEX7_9RHOB|nr:hypothetical protein [Jannaschia sp. GRR-S6-38]WGH79856.1 hypothetical protein P8627_06230 [Jannaschia sp. GRR-S6-38]
MTRKTLTLLALLAFAPLASGCAAVAIGAGGAIVADTIAEEEGGNLF